MLGVSAPAGAINLVTLAAPRVQQLRVQRGPYETWEGRGALGLRRGPFAVQAFGSGFTTRGDFTYHDLNGTTLDTSDDGDSLRLNNRRDVVTALAGLSWLPKNGWSASARQLYHRREVGLPGTGATPALNASFEETWSRTQFEAGRAASGLIPRLRIAGAADVQHLAFRDTEGRLAAGRHDTDDALRGESVAMFLERPRYSRWLTVQGQASLRRDRADLSDPLAGGAPVPESRRITQGATLDLELRPIGERLVLHAARRWERYEDHLRSAGVGLTTRRTDVTRELETPQLGARLALFGGLAARANWSESQRAPEFRELFGNEGSIAPNPALTPEQVRSRDAGLAWHGAPLGRALSVEGWLFAVDADDLILLVRNSPNTLKATNLSRMDNRGAELNAGLALPGGLSLSGAGTWQQARDRGDVKAWRGRKVPMRPDRELHLDAGWNHGWLQAGASLHDIDPNYIDRYNTAQNLIPRRRLVSAALGVTPPHSPFTVTADVKNLGDDHASDLAGTPLPGRMYFLTLDWRLGTAGTAPQHGERP
jgi:outer membrane receptor protein involved in Fe transport